MISSPGCSTDTERWAGPSCSWLHFHQKDSEQRFIWSFMYKKSLSFWIVLDCLCLTRTQLNYTAVQGTFTHLIDENQCLHLSAAHLSIVKLSTCSLLLFSQVVFVWCISCAHIRLYGFMPTKMIMYTWIYTKHKVQTCIEVNLTFDLKKRITWAISKFWSAHSMSPAICLHRKEILIVWQKFIYLQIEYTCSTQWNVSEKFCEWIFSNMNNRFIIPPRYRLAACDYVWPAPGQPQPQDGPPM